MKGSRLSGQNIQSPEKFVSLCQSQGPGAPRYLILIHLGKHLVVCFLCSDLKKNVMPLSLVLLYITFSYVLLTLYTVTEVLPTHSLSNTRAP